MRFAAPMSGMYRVTGGVYKLIPTNEFYDVHRKWWEIWKPKVTKSRLYEVAKFSRDEHDIILSRGEELDLGFTVESLK